MPLDEFILGPMISPYENMIKDVDSQGISNEHVDEMKKCFVRMQDLAQEHSDITTYILNQPSMFYPCQSILGYQH